MYQKVCCCKYYKNKVVIYTFLIDLRTFLIFHRIIYQEIKIILNSISDSLIHNPFCLELIDAGSYDEAKEYLEYFDKIIESDKQEYLRFKQNHNKLYEKILKEIK